MNLAHAFLTSLSGWINDEYYLLRAKINSKLPIASNLNFFTISSQNFAVLEKGKVVLYSTSLNVYRENYYNCMEIRKILQNLMIQFSDYDLFLNRDYQHELKDRIGSDKAEKVPHLFVEGHYVGVSKLAFKYDVAILTGAYAPQAEILWNVFPWRPYALRLET